MLMDNKMDQTTKTADLTETEKCLVNNGGMESNESDSDTEQNTAQDVLLGGIRSGIGIITRTAREALSTCENETELDEATVNIKKASLNLLKLEKSFMRSASIVSEVIDDLVPEFGESSSNTNTQSTEDPSNPEFDKFGSGDVTGNSDNFTNQRQEEPYVFSRSRCNLQSVLIFKEKLTEEYQKRLDAYKSTLSDSSFEGDRKLSALLDQIKLGRNDAITSMLISEKSVKDNATALSKEQNGESESASSILESIPISPDYKEMDDFVLPTVDPISKMPIQFPLKNKYCHHVYERSSILSYIANNPEAKCPVYMCMNPRTLEESHFVSDLVNTHRSCTTQE